MQKSSSAVRKLSTMLIYLGLADAVLTVVVKQWGLDLVGQNPDKLNALIYALVLLPIAGAAILLAQLVLLATQKYAGRLKYVLPQMAFLGMAVALTLPDAIRNGMDVFTPTPTTAAAAVKLIESCQLVVAASPDWDASSTNTYITYRSGRTAKIHDNVWPEIKQATETDAGKCGYENLDYAGDIRGLKTQTWTDRMIRDRLSHQD